MKKKGRIALNHLLLGIIAVLVLVTISYGLYLYFTEQAIPFFKFLPGFNATKPRAVGPEMLRYNLVEGKSQFYDGTAWHDFEGRTIELNEKRISYRDTIGAFISYYFSRHARNYDNYTSSSGNLFAEFWISAVGSSEGIEVPWWSSFKASWEVVFKSDEYIHNAGDTYISVREGGIQKKYVLTYGDEFRILNIEDNVIKSYSVIKNPTGNEKLLRDKAIKWRDSVYISPMEFSYVDLNEKTEKEVFICAERIEKKYLVADLTERVGEDFNCRGGA